MQKTFTIRLEPAGKTIKVNKGVSLAEIVHEYGVEFPCGGKGTCGGCRVKVLDGHIPLTTDHKAALEKNGLSDEWRLACLSYVEDDLVLEIAQWESIILADNTLFDFTPRKGYGIAIDLGTTTIVSQLIDLSNANVLDVQTSMNPQSRYGADIMSRIEYALSNKDNLTRLTKLVRDAIQHHIEELLKEEQNKEVKDVVIVGNTVMHHLFGSKDVQPLALYPFETNDGGVFLIEPSEVCSALPASCRIRFLPIIGSFVGSDILAGILSSGIHKSDKPAILIDMGTNGEIVAGNKKGILCASTAAGPAFEGTNIAMGMKATTGAISAVNANHKKINAHVIGNTTPRGICGSGLIDAIATLVKKGDIDEGGQIINDKDKIMLADPVYITQKDVREFQLAKAAIAAGLQIIMDEMGIQKDHIDKVFIAGGFGNFIDIDNTIALGLLEFPKNKIYKLTNTALMGAKMFLFENDTVIDDILAKTKHISLEANMQFQDVFVEKMMF